MRFFKKICLDLFLSFMFFVKNDVKVARTHDKKIMIINCKIDKGKTWIIEEEFYL